MSHENVQERDHAHPEQRSQGAQTPFLLAGGKGPEPAVAGFPSAVATSTRKRHEGALQSGGKGGPRSPGGSS